MEFTARHAGAARFSLSRSSREGCRVISRICSSAGTPPRRTSPDDILCDGTPVGFRREQLPEVVHKERSSGLVAVWSRERHGADPWNPFHP